jgi:phosphoglycolate phosphatase-like HAD superfamily hydrolase
MLQRIHVYDLDGVLVDTSHRYRNKPDGSIDLAYWFANRTEKKMREDKLLPLANQYIDDCLNADIYTILCTARSYHPLDIAFIFSFLGAPDKLFMRPVEDERPDAIIKFAQLNGFFNLRQFQNVIKKLWEDNPRNIEKLQPLFDKCFYIPSTIGGSH